MTPFDHKVVARRFAIADFRLTSTAMWLAGVILVALSRGLWIWLIGVGLMLASWVGTRQVDRALRDLNELAYGEKS